MSHTELPVPSFTCPECGRTSFHPQDIAEGYCGNCHDWTFRPPSIVTAHLPEPKKERGCE